MTLDADVVRGRCEEIAQSLGRLRELAHIPREDFVGDRDARDIACYRLLVAIEAALALCYHVCARQLRIAPEDYAGCFATLASAGLIEGDLSSRLQQMARFRNLLVHVYWHLDYGRVHDVLQHDVEDLDEFSRIVAALI